MMRRTVRVSCGSSKRQQLQALLSSIRSKRRAALHVSMTAAAAPPTSSDPAPAGAVVLSESAQNKPPQAPKECLVVDGLQYPASCACFAGAGPGAVPNCTLCRAVVLPTPRVGDPAASPAQMELLAAKAVLNSATKAPSPSSSSTSSTAQIGESLVQLCDASGVIDALEQQGGTSRAMQVVLTDVPSVADDQEAQLVRTSAGAALPALGNVDAVVEWMRPLPISAAIGVLQARGLDRLTPQIMDAIKVRFDAALSSSESCDDAVDCAADLSMVDVAAVVVAAKVSFQPRLAALLNTYIADIPRRPDAMTRLEFAVAALQHWLEDRNMDAPQRSPLFAKAVVAYAKLTGQSSVVQQRMVDRFPEACEAFANDLKDVANDEAIRILVEGHALPEVPNVVENVLQLASKTPESLLEKIHFMFDDGFARDCPADVKLLALRAAIVRLLPHASPASPDGSLSAPVEGGPPLLAETPLWHKIWSRMAQGIKAPELWSAAPLAFWSDVCAELKNFVPQQSESQTAAAMPTNGFKVAAQSAATMLRAERQWLRGSGRDVGATTASVSPRFVGLVSRMLRHAATADPEGAMEWLAITQSIAVEAAAPSSAPVVNPNHPGQAGLALRPVVLQALLDSWHHKAQSATMSTLQRLASFKPGALIAIPLLAFTHPSGPLDAEPFIHSLNREQLLDVSRSLLNTEDGDRLANALGFTVPADKLRQLETSVAQRLAGLLSTYLRSTDLGATTTNLLPAAEASIVNEDGLAIAEVLLQRGVQPEPLLRCVATPLLIKYVRDTSDQHKGEKPHATEGSDGPAGSRALSSHSELQAMHRTIMDIMMARFRTTVVSTDTSPSQWPLSVAEISEVGELIFGKREDPADNNRMPEGEEGDGEGLFSGALNAVVDVVDACVDHLRLRKIQLRPCDVPRPSKRVHKAPTDPPEHYDIEDELERIGRVVATPILSPTIAELYAKEYQSLLVKLCSQPSRPLLIDENLPHVVRSFPLPSPHQFYEESLLTCINIISEGSAIKRNGPPPGLARLVQKIELLIPRLALGVFRNAALLARTDVAREVLLEAVIRQYMLSSVPTLQRFRSLGRVWRLLAQFVHRRELSPDIARSLYNRCRWLFVLSLTSWANLIRGLLLGFIFFGLYMRRSWEAFVVRNLTISLLMPESLSLKFDVEMDCGDGSDTVVLSCEREFLQDDDVDDDAGGGRYHFRFAHTTQKLRPNPDDDAVVVVQRRRSASEAAEDSRSVEERYEGAADARTTDEMVLGVDGAQRLHTFCLGTRDAVQSTRKQLMQLGRASEPQEPAVCVVTLNTERAQAACTLRGRPEDGGAGGLLAFLPGVSQADLDGVHLKLRTTSIDDFIFDAAWAYRLSLRKRRLTQPLFGVATLVPLSNPINREMLVEAMKGVTYFAEVPNHLSVDPVFLQQLAAAMRRSSSRCVLLGSNRTFARCEHVLSESPKPEELDQTAATVLPEQFLCCLGDVVPVVTSVVEDSIEAHPRAAKLSEVYSKNVKAAEAALSAWVKSELRRGGVSFLAASHSGFAAGAPLLDLHWSIKPQDSSARRVFDTLATSSHGGRWTDNIGNRCKEWAVNVARASVVQLHSLRSACGSSWRSLTKGPAALAQPQ